MMQYGVKEVRRQEVVERGVQCFKYREKEHKKWECSRIKKEKKRKEKEALPPKVWRKVQEHSRAKTCSQKKQ